MRRRGRQDVLVPAAEERGGGSELHRLSHRLVGSQVNAFGVLDKDGIAAGADERFDQGLRVAGPPSLPSRCPTATHLTELSHLAGSRPGAKIDHGATRRTPKTADRRRKLPSFCKLSAAFDVSCPGKNAPLKEGESAALRLRCDYFEAS